MSQADFDREYRVLSLAHSAIMLARLRHTLAPYLHLWIRMLWCRGKMNAATVVSFRLRMIRAALKSDRSVSKETGVAKNLLKTSQKVVIIIN